MRRGCLWHSRSPQTSLIQYTHLKYCAYCPDRAPNMQVSSQEVVGRSLTFSGAKGRPHSLKLDPKPRGHHNLQKARAAPETAPEVRFLRFLQACKTGGAQRQSGSQSSSGISNYVRLQEKPHMSRGHRMACSPTSMQTSCSRLHRPNHVRHLHHRMRNTSLLIMSQVGGHC